MFKSHTCELVPGSDNVTTVDSCISGTGLRYFESLLAPVPLKVTGLKGSAMGFAHPQSSAEFQGVWGGAGVKRKYASQDFSFSCL